MAFETVGRNRFHSPEVVEGKVAVWTGRAAGWGEIEQYQDVDTAFLTNGSNAPS